MEEIWKDIKGYEGLYMISNFGRVISKKNNSIKKNTLMANGYYGVGLWKNNKQKISYIHRLIAEAFIDNPKNKCFVNHKDGNKKNNHIDNLEWCTRSENADHAYRTGLCKRNKPIRCVETGKEYRSGCEAAISVYGKRKYASGILGCANGNYKNHRGLHWEFIKKG